MKNYTSQVYEIIKELVQKYDEKAQVKYLCGIAMDLCQVFRHEKV